MKFVKEIVCAAVGAIICCADGAVFDYVKTVKDVFGSNITVRCTGNDAYCQYETLDGVKLVPDKFGHFVPAGGNMKCGAVSRTTSNGALLQSSQSERARMMEKMRERKWNARKKQTQARLNAASAGKAGFAAPPATPTVGSQVGILILADFPYAKDTSRTVRQVYHSEVTKEYVENAVNSLTWTRTTKGATETSMRKYYRDQSQNLFDYQNFVTDWILLDGTRIEYDYPYDFDNSKDWSTDAEYDWVRTTDPAVIAAFSEKFPGKNISLIFTYRSATRGRPRTRNSLYNTWSYDEHDEYSINALSGSEYYGVWDPYMNYYCQYYYLYPYFGYSGWFAGYVQYDNGQCAQLVFDELFGKVAAKGYDLTGLTREVIESTTTGYNSAQFSDGINAQPKVSKMRVSFVYNINTIKNFNVVYAGKCPQNWAYGLWPHSYVVTEPNVITKLKYRCSDTVNGQKATVYELTAKETSMLFSLLDDMTDKKEYEFDSAYAMPCKYEMTSVISQPDKDDGSTITFDISTLCHENGHMACDFPDLYAYDGQGQGVGYFSLMAANTKIPQNIDPYLRMHAGWLTPTELPKDGAVHTYTITTDKNNVYKFTNPNNSKEYYLIENRQQSGSDAFIPSHGLIIWRCNENGSNTHSSDTYKEGEYLKGFATGVYRRDYEASVEQADGLYHMEIGDSDDKTTWRGDIYDGWYRGNSKMPSEFNDDSKPTARWKDASASGLRIFDISASGNTMTFSYQYVGQPPAPTTHTVTFKVGDFVYNTQQVADGGSAQRPADPTYLNCSAMQYKTFKSWDKGFDAITADTVVNAVTSGNTISHSVTGNTYQYDGNSHTFTVNVSLSNAGVYQIMYSVDGSQWSTTQPSYTEAGSYTTKYRVEANNYPTIESAGVLTIIAGPGPGPGPTTLVEGVDYTLSYRDNVNTGCATIMINGIGSYEGQLTTTFWIYKYGFFYTGAEICPKVALTFRGKELVEGKDYELSYANNIEVGDGQITVTGKGNFVGIKLMYFQILPSDNVSPAVAKQWNDRQIIRVPFGR